MNEKQDTSNISKAAEQKAVSTQSIPQANINKAAFAKLKYRQPKFIIAVGSKGIGKTYTTLQLIKKYILGDQIKKLLPRKVIIFDYNREFPQFKTIPVDKAFDPNAPDWVLLFSSNDYKKYEVRRILPLHKDGTNMSIDEINIVLSYVLESFWGGLFLIEDITKYVADSPNRDISGTLATIRHKNCDVIVHFQWKSKALNPKFWGCVNELRVHKTTDSFSDYADRVKGDPHLLMIAEYLENNMNEQKLQNATQEQLEQADIPIQTFHCTVDVEHGKIKGPFTKQDFRKAAHKYIAMNKKKALAEYLEDFDPKSGEKLYTFQQAYEMKMNKIMETYYGNEN